MADNYRQYTSCSRPKDWHSLAIHLVQVSAFLLFGIPVAIVLAGPCAWFYAAVVVAAEAVAGCDWWLYTRLVCLDGDQSAAGMLVKVEPARGKSGLFNELDTDYSINLLLYPNPPGVTQAVAETTPPYGKLIKNQPDVATHLGFFEGETASEPGIVPERESAVLHAEFEGAGVHDFLIGASIALGLAIAAVIACVAIPPPWGLAAAAFLAFFAFLALLFSYLGGMRDYADPSDVTGAPVELHTNVPDPANPTVPIGADLLYVYGTWIFDSLHGGWNEIHPIKKCTRIGTWTGTWPTNTTTMVAKLDQGFANARDPATIAQQAQPAHQWRVHPMIDGCGSYPWPGPIVI
jgi:hypothetical protein